LHLNIATSFYQIPFNNFLYVLSKRVGAGASFADKHL